MEPIPADRDELENLAGYHRCMDRICAAWPGFLARRAERLARAAAHAGHLSPAASNPAAVYRRLTETLKQFGITPELD